MHPASARGARTIKNRFIGLTPSAAPIGRVEAKKYASEWELQGAAPILAGRRYKGSRLGRWIGVEDVPADTRGEREEFGPTRQHIVRMVVGRGLNGSKNLVLATLAIAGQ